MTETFEGVGSGCDVFTSRQAFILPHPTTLILDLSKRAMVSLRAFVEDPYSSYASAAFHVLILLLIVASCTSVILQTMPEYRENPMFSALEALVTVVFSGELLLSCLLAAGERVVKQKAGETVGCGYWRVRCIFYRYRWGYMSWPAKTTSRISKSWNVYNYIGDQSARY